MCDASDMSRFRHDWYPPGLITVLCSGSLGVELISAVALSVRSAPVSIRMVF